MFYTGRYVLKLGGVMSGALYLGGVITGYPPFHHLSFFNTPFTLECSFNFCFHSCRLCHRIAQNIVNQQGLSRKPQYNNKRRTISSLGTAIYLLIKRCFFSQKLFCHQNSGRLFQHLIHVPSNSMLGSGETFKNFSTLATFQGDGDVYERLILGRFFRRNRKQKNQLSRRRRRHLSSVICKTKLKDLKMK